MILHSHSVSGVRVKAVNFPIRQKWMLFVFLIFNCEHIKVCVWDWFEINFVKTFLQLFIFIQRSLILDLLNLSFIVLWFFSQIKADVISVLPLPMLSFHVSLHWGLFIRLSNFFFLSSNSSILRGTNKLEHIAKKEKNEVSLFQLFDYYKVA